MLLMLLNPARGEVLRAGGLAIRQGLAGFGKLALGRVGINRHDLLPLVVGSESISVLPKRAAAEDQRNQGKHDAGSTHVPHGTVAAMHAQPEPLSMNAARSEMLRAASFESSSSALVMLRASDPGPAGSPRST